MTVREFIQTLILESPNFDLDVDVYIVSEKDEVEKNNYKIINISSYGNNDSIFIDIEKEY